MAYQPVQLDFIAMNTNRKNWTEHMHRQAFKYILHLQEIILTQQMKCALQAWLLLEESEAPQLYDLYLKHTGPGKKN